MDKAQYAAARASAIARMLPGAQDAPLDKLSAMVCGILDAAGLTGAELDALVTDAVAQAEAQLGAPPTMKNMGLVIKAVNAAAAGRAEGAVVAARVKAALSRT